MVQRGRKSSASVAIQGFLNVSSMQRPDAPYELTDEQSEVWRRVVDAMPADWFNAGTWGELASYCRHSVTARRVAQLVTQHERADDFDIDTYDQLLRMQERETRAMSSLATRLRLTPQTQYEPDKVRRVNRTAKPWQALSED